MKFGRPCTRCKSYFVTDDPQSFVCFWCQKTGPSMAFDPGFDPSLLNLSGELNDV